MKINRVSAILVGVAVLLFFVAGGNALAAPAQTGQGIMVNITTAGNFAFTETQTYSFNVTTASGYYTNAWDGNSPTLTNSQTIGPSGPGACTPAVPPGPPRLLTRMALPGV